MKREICAMTASVSMRLRGAEAKTELEGRSHERQTQTQGPSFLKLALPLR